MPRISISQMNEGDSIHQSFILTNKQLGTTSSNKLYLKADCNDATGSINCRGWNITRDQYNRLPTTGYVMVRGRVESYQGHLQLVAEEIVRITDLAQVNIGELLRQTQKSVPDMLVRLRAIIGQIKHPEIAAIVKAFLDDEEFMKKFALSPAAQSFHHAWIGGLLEHTLALLELGLVICPKYKDIDQDVVLAGLFLHDIGKTAELSYEFGFDYTDKGRLVGHIVLGTLWLNQRAQQIAAARGKPFRADVLMALEHIVLSHHGEPEFGAAVTPRTPEAILVNMIDNLDAKTQMALDAVASPTEEGNWTDFHRAFGGKLYRPSISAGGAE